MLSRCASLRPCRLDGGALSQRGALTTGSLGIFCSRSTPVRVFAIFALLAFNCKEGPPLTEGMKSEIEAILSELRATQPVE